MTQIGEGIWIFERPFRLFGAEFGNRMTVLKLSDDALLVHSPVAFDDEVRREVEALGRVAYIITPNNFHGLFVDDWMSAFPGARHVTAKDRDNASTFEAESLSGSPIAEWLPTLDAIRVEGVPKVNEFAFFHRPSRTLILTDLAFNVGMDVSLWTKIFFSLNGAYGKFGPSRLMRSMIEDQQALQGSLLKILDWDFERIVISHGVMVERNGKEVMRRAFQRYLINTPSPKRASRRAPVWCG